MASIMVYGAGGIYNDGSVYGRIDPALAAAQALTMRETDLRVKVYDDHLNDYIAISGFLSVTIGRGGVLHQPTVYSTDQAYSEYRLTYDACALANGHIVRVRNGNGTVGDRNIYIQDISDPTDSFQWINWTLLYSGTFYAVAIIPASASTYHVYSASATGIRKNNVAKQSLTGIVSIAPVRGAIDAMFVTRVFADSLDGKRVMDVAYSSNIETTAFSDDEFNYRWLRTEINAILMPDGRVARIQTAGWGTDPRSTNLAESLTIAFNPSLTNLRPVDPPRLIRGFAGQAGSNAIVHPYLTRLSDGFYYLFYGESRFDADKDVAISVATLFWQRSKDLIYWTEPVAVGFDNMTPTGHAVVETGGRVYITNNGKGWSRAVATTEYDISNYIPELSMSIPKTLEEGSASFTVANPNGINDYLEDLSDHRMTIEVGLRSGDGTWNYEQFNDWWLHRAKKEMQAQVNRLTVTAYDITKRLNNPLRDVFNFTGRTYWHDWAIGKRNKLFNYYIRGGKSSMYKSSSTSLYLKVTRINRTYLCLYTGWKGHNADFSVRFRGGKFISGEKFGLIYRYKDGKNYYWAHIDGQTLRLQRRRNNVAVNLASYSIGSYLNNPTISVSVRFGFHFISINGVLRITHNETVQSVNPGYIGIRYYRATKTGDFGADNFVMLSWETPYTSDDLVATALAMGDMHNVSIDAGDQPQVAVVWGPQTDLNTPAAAISKLFSQLKLDMVRRNGILTVGKFEDLEIIKTIQNESLDFKVTEETGERINLAIVDGREDTYTAIDGRDSRTRGRQIVAYFDVPELDTTEKVIARANQEIRKGVEGVSYEGTAPLFMDLWRLDAVTWYDPTGVPHDLRIDEISIEINQSDKPNQKTKYTLSPLS